MNIFRFLHLVLLAGRIWFWICVANWTNLGGGGYPLKNLGFLFRFLRLVLLASRILF